MTDFGFDDFEEYNVQGRPIKVYKNGNFVDSKTLFLQQFWSWDEFLCAATQRLDMIPKAQRVFNADGTEIDDIMCVEDDDMLFFSSGESFQVPSLRKSESQPRNIMGNSLSDDQRDASNLTNAEGSEIEDDDEFSGVVGGYKISSFLGRGGFGEVRLGVHQLTDEHVALKFILKSEMGSLGDVERTTTEIQCLTALNHPNIIKLLRVMNEPEHMVLCVELLEGGDLLHFLRELHPEVLSEEKCAQLFKQIIAGVAYAHNQHICHRDLKLENILLANKNDISDVKIADFGLSDFYRPGAMVKTNCGSISYLAPEVFRGTCNAGPPLDVWSLGVILYAICFGKLPFEGTDLHGTNRPRENVIRNRILRCQYKIEEGAISAEAKDLMTRILNADPSERATIPEIFNHPWLRGCKLDITAKTILPSEQTDESANSDSTATGTEEEPRGIKNVYRLHESTVSLSSDENLPSSSQRSPDRNSPGNPLVLPVQTNTGPRSQRNKDPKVSSLTSPRTSRRTSLAKTTSRGSIRKKGSRRTLDKVAAHREANLPGEEKSISTLHTTIPKPAPQKHLSKE